MTREGIGRRLCPIRLCLLNGIASRPDGRLGGAIQIPERLPALDKFIGQLLMPRLGATEELECRATRPTHH